MKALNFFLLTFLTFMVIAPMSGQSYRLTKSDFSISGTSNLHDWESAVTKVSWRGTFSFSDGVLSELSDVKVNIPVDGITSTKGRIMDGKTHTALKAEEHPNIVFTLTSANITNNSNKSTVAAKGKLTVAGVTKTINLQVLFTPLADGQCQVTGTYPMKMTDYGIEPPTALLGTLTTGDDVTIKFNLTLSPN
ncbi:YceI family protein [Lewinella sp. LCG006]|uniref:YceI family protein n=1 Tax=Lewinella sp. LCG006 TaxID=3231911 RepID=UPI00346010BD